MVVYELERSAEARVAAQPEYSASLLALRDKILRSSALLRPKTIAEEEAHKYEINTMR